MPAAPTVDPHARRIGGSFPNNNNGGVDLIAAEAGTVMEDVATNRLELQLAISSRIGPRRKIRIGLCQGGSPTPGRMRYGGNPTPPLSQGPGWRKYPGAAAVTTSHHSPIICRAP